MIERADIERVRMCLTENVGKRIRLTAKKGRKRVVVRQGYIKSTYPSLFIVVLDSVSEFASGGRTISFNYSDILIKNVSVTILDTKQEVE
ncbi:MAG: protein veg [Ruminococcaceae bacterium]|nr:protein veg [Oscillospiraceae bacterium]